MHSSVIMVVLASVASFGSAVVAHEPEGHSASWVNSSSHVIPVATGEATNHVMATGFPSTAIVSATVPHHTGSDSFIATASDSAHSSNSTGFPIYSTPTHNGTANFTSKTPSASAPTATGAAAINTFGAGAMVAAGIIAVLGTAIL